MAQGLSYMFQFTQPKRAATYVASFSLGGAGVSIHAAQAGCDRRVRCATPCLVGFNSRSPSGLRHLRYYTNKSSSASFNSRSPSGLRPTRRKKKPPIETFQFTQPKRAATGDRQSYKLSQKVSIHAAQAGCDNVPARSSSCQRVFQFTQPKRAATRVSSELRRTNDCFNSRSPSGLRRLLQRYNKKEIHSKDKSRKSILVIILDEEAKAVKLELTDNQPLRNSNKIMFTWDSQPNIFV